MKLHDDTLSVLKNFAAINKNILIRPGSVLRTVSPSKTVMGKAQITDEFEKEICLYDLHRFLNTVGLFDEPDIDFKDTHLTINSGPSSIIYSYANPELVVAAKNSDLDINDWIDTFHVKVEVLQAVDRARKTLGLDEVSFEADGEKLWIKAVDASGTTNDEYALELGSSDRKFKAVIKSDNLELLPRSYDVSISPRGITHWKSSGIEYWIVMIANRSSFEDV
jgi:hypothetical protein